VTVISVDAPLSMAFNSETILVVGKYRCRICAPDSYTDHPNDIGTGTSGWRSMIFRWH
jgi:hypothetical protein